MRSYVFDGAKKMWSKNYFQVSQRARNPYGFTLIEVVIAVAILSSALITILGLQSSIMTRTLRDEGRQQAMLQARSILAAIENNIEQIEVQDQEQPVDQLLEKLLIHAPTKAAHSEENRFQFNARLSVDLWSIPNIKDDALKRIQLKIYSPDLPEDSFDVLFFIPNEEVKDPV